MKWLAYTCSTNDTCVVGCCRYCWQNQCLSEQGKYIFSQQGTRLDEGFIIQQGTRMNKCINVIEERFLMDIIEIEDIESIHLVWNVEHGTTEECFRLLVLGWCWVATVSMAWWKLMACSQLLEFVEILGLTYRLGWCFNGIWCRCRGISDRANLLNCLVVAEQ